MNALAARILAAVTVAAGAAVLVGPQPVSTAGGLLLGFVLPGLALTATLLRGRTLTPVERTMLAPALSLAVLVIAGLAIYLSGFVLNRIAWTSATVGVTLMALIVPGVPLPRRWQRHAGSWNIHSTIMASQNNNAMKLPRLSKMLTLPSSTYRPTHL